MMSQLPIQITKSSIFFDVHLCPPLWKVPPSMRRLYL